MTRYQTTEQDYDLRIVSKNFKNATIFKYSKPLLQHVQCDRLLLVVITFILCKRERNTTRSQITYQTAKYYIIFTIFNNTIIIAQWRSRDFSRRKGVIIKGGRDAAAPSSAAIRLFKI